MKKILMLGMGGTIASEMTPEGLTPDLSPEQLLRYVPAISQLCQVVCRQLFTIDSTNVEPHHWVAAAQAIQEVYDDYDGFVISHGTDTMAYTAAALSYLIQGARKPVILTGAQRPISFENTDSKINLTDAFLCACSEEIAGVHIVFNGRVIRGTRARKTRSKSFQAFSSINFPYTAMVQDGRLLQYIRQTDLPERPTFADTLDKNVGLIKLVPGVDLELLEFLLSRKDAVIIESFGVGGLPSYGGDGFHQLIRRYANEGKFVVMTTQVQNEGSDLAVYSVGRRLKDWPNVMEAYDMTTECVLAKIMWILGQTRDSQRVSELFYRPVADDILLGK
jgi:L-asparaginase